MASSPVDVVVADVMVVGISAWLFGLPVTASIDKGLQDEGAHELAVAQTHAARARPP